MQDHADVNSDGGGTVVIPEIPDQLPRTLSAELATRAAVSQEEKHGESSLTKDFNTRKMVSMVRERTMDSQDFYKRVNCLPLKIRQMTFISEDYDSGTTAMNIDMHRQNKPNGKNDHWNSDIVKQVDSWMKSRPILDRYDVSPRVVFTPPRTQESLRRRRQKRHRLRVGEDMDTAESIAESIVSMSSERSMQKSVSSELKPYPNVRQKYVKFSRSSENLTNETQEKAKPSHGNAYNEIEFQKRYRRINDLKSHLQFVNTTCLSGQNILKKTHRLPPMDYDSDKDSTLAISTVQKTNEPEEQLGLSAESSVYTTSNIMTTHISPFHERDNPDALTKPPWLLTNNTNNRTEIRSFEKFLPRQKSPNTLKLPTIHTRRIMRKKTDPRNSLSVSDYQVISETDIPGLEPLPTSRESHRTTGKDSQRSSRRKGDSRVSCNNTDEQTNEDNNDEDDDVPDFGLRELKVSIHIKYKKNDEKEIPWYARQPDGKVRADYLKHNNDTMTVSKEMKHLSE